MASMYEEARAAYEAAEGDTVLRARMGVCEGCGEVFSATEYRRGRNVLVEGSCTSCGHTMSRAGYAEVAE